MQLRQTEDGSSTLYVPELDEHYHSTHGAVQESLHVFIAAGYNNCPSATPRIFELGFGTGLNALLTAIEAEQQQRRTIYYSVEKFPVPLAVVQTLNYTAPQSNMQQYADLFAQIHAAAWDQLVQINEWFALYKISGDANQADLPANIDLIYFDAFAPDKQPELWGEALFNRLFAQLNSNGVLVTYCAKGVLKRTLRAVGFVVEGLPGPPGKREMTRARKCAVKQS